MSPEAGRWGSGTGCAARAATQSHTQRAGTQCDCCQCVGILTTFSWSSPALPFCSGPCKFRSRSFSGGRGHRRVPPGWAPTVCSDSSGPALRSAPPCAAVGAWTRQLHAVPRGRGTRPEAGAYVYPGSWYLSRVNSHGGHLPPLRKALPSRGEQRGREKG